VVVAPDGSLLGYGKGCPPSWCATAAAAETWALAKALSFNAFPPLLRTDCQSLLTIAEEGTQKALAANKPLARAWQMIAGALDGDIACLIRDARLAWLPAHLPMAAIGERRLSNGTRLTAVDWRANRLVDALAKQAAATRQAPAPVIEMLMSAKAAVKHAAALLGEVTFAVNNHSITVTNPDGSQSTRVIRDSMPKARGAAKPAASYTERAAPSANQTQSCSSPDVVPSLAMEPLMPRAPLSINANRAREFAQRRRLEDKTRTWRRIEEVFVNARPRSHDDPARPTGHDRLQAVLERVRVRSADHATGSNVLPASASVVGGSKLGLPQLWMECPSRRTTSGARRTRSSLTASANSLQADLAQAMCEQVCPAGPGLEEAQGVGAAPGAQRAAADAGTDRRASFRAAADAETDVAGDTALRDLMELERSGSAVTWPRCQPRPPSGEASRSHLALRAASSRPASSSLRPAVVSTHTGDVLAELADLQACGLRVRWPAG